MRFNSPDFYVLVSAIETQESAAGCAAQREIEERGERREERRREERERRRRRKKKRRESYAIAFLCDKEENGSELSQ